MTLKDDGNQEIVHRTEYVGQIIDTGGGNDQQGSHLRKTNEKKKAPPRQCRNC